MHRNLIAALLATALSSCAPVYAAAVATGEGQGAAITLYDEPCALPAVSNLTFRSSWLEGGKTFEGCYAVRTEVGAVVIYSEDGSVALVPISVFRLAVGV